MTTANLKIGLQHSILKTKMLQEDGTLSRPWQEYNQSIIKSINASPQGYSVTHAQRLALPTKTLNIGSMAFETDTHHVLSWSGTAWVQLV